MMRAGNTKAEPEAPPASPPEGSERGERRWQQTGLASAVGAILYQGVWFACVFGGNRVGLPAAAAAAALHFGVLKGDRRDGAMMGVTLATGLVVDSALMHAGIYRFGNPAGPFCPLWFLAIWAHFGLLFARPLRWLLKRPVTAAVLGAVGGPLAYRAGAASGALQIAEGALPLCIMAAVWAALMLWFVRMARRIQAPRAPACGKEPTPESVPSR